jgi:DNA-directed RNA polymerase specialized sigma24 family protein
VIEAEPDEDMPHSRDESLVWQLRQALAVLPPSQRAATVVQEVGGPSYAEISERLGVTAGAA